jgi:hypothetical protein
LRRRMLLKGKLPLTSQPERLWRNSIRVWWLKTSSGNATKVEAPACRSSLINRLNRIMQLTSIRDQEKCLECLIKCRRMLRNKHKHKPLKKSRNPFLTRSSPKIPQVPLLVKPLFSRMTEPWPFSPIFSQNKLHDDHSTRVL